MDVFHLVGSARPNNESDVRRPGSSQLKIRYALDSDSHEIDQGINMSVMCEVQV